MTRVLKIRRSLRTIFTISLFRSDRSDEVARVSSRRFVISGRVSPESLDFIPVRCNRQNLMPSFLSVSTTFCRASSITSFKKIYCAEMTKIIYFRDFPVFPEKLGTKETWEMKVMGGQDKRETQGRKVNLEN